MLRSAGLWRAIVRRARTDWPVVAAAWILVVAATTLLAAGVVFGDAVAVGSVRRALLAAPPTDRAILVDRSVARTDAAALDRLVRPELADAIAPTGGEVDLVARSGSFAAADSDPATVTDLFVLGAYERLDEHADLVRGRWPVAAATPLEASLSEAAARALDVRPGDELALANRLDPTRRLSVRVVGLWRPRAGDAYWAGSTLELEGQESRGGYTTHGPVAVTRDDLLASGAIDDISAQWRALPDLSALRVASIDELRRNVETLRARLGAAVSGAPVSVATTLPARLAETGRSSLVSRGGVLLLTIQFAIVAGYALALVAGLLVERRRAETALLRSRGATAVHLGAMAFGEALLLAVPAALVAPWLAVATVDVLGRIGPLAGSGILSGGTPTDAALGVSVLAAAACVVMLTVVAVTSGAGGTLRGALGRQATRTLAQRLGVDLVLVTLAAVALWQLRLYGAPLTRNARGILGLDPLLVGAPAIGLLAGALLATRLVPRIAELGLRLLERRRGLVGPLGGRQVARRPLRYTRSALLIMLAGSLGTFASAHAATWSRSQADQATYQAASGVRVRLSTAGNGPGVGATIHAIPGVEGASPVISLPLDIGRRVRAGTVLAVDPSAATAAAQGRADPTDPQLGGLLAALAGSRAPDGALSIPAEAARLRVTVDTDLHGDVPNGVAGVDPAARVVDVSAVVEDGDGLLVRLSGMEGLAAKADGQAAVIPLDADATAGGRTPLRGPFRLHAIELSLALPSEAAVIGSLAVRSVAVSGPSAAWTGLPLAVGTDGWRWANNVEDVEPATGDPARVTISPPQAIFGFGVTVTFRLWSPADPDAPLAAIVGRSLADATGARVGDVVAANVRGTSVRLRIVGTTDAFAPLDPAVPFAVVDERALARTRFATTADTTLPDEWWLTVSPGAEPSVVEALSHGAVPAVEVIGRDARAHALANDPVPLGVIGVLGLGSVAAMAFAAVGFVVSATVSTTERLGEFALLRALGLSARELSVWLSLENVFLLAVGLVAGTGLGLLLAWLVLPFATLTQTGATPVPAPVVVVPWEGVLPPYLVALALLAVTLFIIRRQLPAIRISDVLRGRDE